MARPVATPVLRLPANSRPTEAIGNVGERPRPAASLEVLHFPDPTESDVLGPYYRKGAPFRAKISPPFASGQVMVIRGRVWGFDTKRPLPRTTLELWQASAEGHYDNDDPSHPPAPKQFVNRARLITDETGFYEFETIHP